MSVSFLVWTGLIITIVLLLCFDLLVLHKKDEVNNKKTAKETIFWIGVALAQCVMIYLSYKNEWIPNPTGLSGQQAVLKYFTGYLIELSLSVDNLFVIAMIFKSFDIPLKYQHRALFWGILGAIVFRGIMIAVGVVLFQRFHWIPYVFGAFLIYTAFKLLYDELKGGDDEDVEDTPMRRLMKKYLKISPNLNGHDFFTVENGVRVATPLFGALVMIELTDLLFAFDSIPAILAVTQDGLLVFCATIFATLGLRSMYFFLANMLDRFHYLKYSVFVILFYIGIKLILMPSYEIPEWLSLSVIIVSLAAGVLISLKLEKEKND